jgi:hypothetical protein
MGNEKVEGLEAGTKELGSSFERFERRIGQLAESDHRGRQRSRGGICDYYSLDSAEYPHYFYSIPLI